MDNAQFDKFITQKNIKVNDSQNLIFFSNSYLPLFKNDFKKFFDLFGSKNNKVQIKYNDNINLEIINFFSKKIISDLLVVLYLDPRNFLDNLEWKNIQKTYDLILSYKSDYNLFITNYFDKSLLISLGIDRIKINKILNCQQKIAVRNNIKILNFDHISNRLGTNQFYDFRMWSNAKLPINPIYSNIFFYNFVYQILNNLRTQFKVLVFDLDNTLWGGVIGDDGEENLNFSKDDPHGFPYFLIHKTILALKKKGYLLCISSKNNEQIVKSFFNKKILGLKYHDFVLKFINWEQKSVNIKLMSNQLNISTDQFIFFDDNSLERETVKINFKNKIFVPNFDNPDELLEILNCILMVENKKKISKEDKQRTKYLSTTIKFNKLKDVNKNLNTYLLSLKQELVIEKVCKKNVDRFLQLLDRTNQFNFNKNLDINNILNDSSYKKYIVKFNDSLGDYGYIATLILNKKDNILFIENLVLSCRVFQRKIEYGVLQKIFSLKEHSNSKIIVGKFYLNNRNKDFKDFYTNLRFRKINKNHFQISRAKLVFDQEIFFQNIKLLN